MFKKIFQTCREAIRQGEEIHRKTQSDKEFHFQNWFQDRLEDLGVNYTLNGRNSYPDFLINDSNEGFEIKGLTHPGRSNDFDANSQVPLGKHEGREIFYVFGRYPRTSDNNYPVLDLVICHGSLLNDDDGYEHENKSTRGFGSYGDILIRDRKMYVPPTPFGLLNGLEEMVTFIIPDRLESNLDDFQEVGRFTRSEVPKTLRSYTFDLETNELKTNLEKNPTANKRHNFVAYRIDGDDDRIVNLK